MSPLVFLAILLGTAGVALGFDRWGGVWGDYCFNGLLAAQFTLLGVLFGIANWPRSRRWRIVLVGSGLLCAAFLGRRHVNVYELILAASRLIYISVPFLWLRLARHVVLSHDSTLTVYDSRKFRILHLMIVTLLVAFLLAFSGFLQEYTGPGGELFRLAVVLCIAFFAALIPLTVAWAVLSQRGLAAGVPSRLTAMILIASLGTLIFFASSGWREASTWTANALVEAILVSSILGVFRYRGYRLVVRQPAHR